MARIQAGHVDAGSSLGRARGRHVGHVDVGLVASAQVINGGYTHYEQRVAYCQKAAKALIYTGPEVRLPPGYLYALSEATWG